MIPEIRLTIGIPSQGTMCTDTALCLAFMVANLSQIPMRGYNGHTWEIWNVKSSILPQGRQSIADHVLDSDATHLLFIDTDMHFPPNTAHRLLSHRKDVVACNCPTRGFPCNPTARLDGGMAGEVVSSVDKTGLQRVWRVGTGIMLISVKALKQLRRPFFTPYWSEERDAYVGEDWALCEQLEGKGIPIYVDHTLSKEIGHIGSYRFQHTDIGRNMS